MNVRDGGKRRRLFENNCQDCFEEDDLEMVQCDSCDKWSHYRCEGVGPEVVYLKYWICQHCKRDTNSVVHPLGLKANN